MAIIERVVQEPRFSAVLHLGGIPSRADAARAAIMVE